MSYCMFFLHIHRVSLEGIAAWFSSGSLLRHYHCLKRRDEQRHIFGKAVMDPEVAWPSVLWNDWPFSRLCSFTEKDPPGICSVFCSIHLSWTDKNTHVSWDKSTKHAPCPFPKKHVVDFDADPSLCVAPAYSLVWCQVVVSVAVEINTHPLWTVVINICLV